MYYFEIILIGFLGLFICIFLYLLFRQVYTQGRIDAYRDYLKTLEDLDRVDAHRDHVRLFGELERENK